MNTDSFLRHERELASGSDNDDDYGDDFEDDDGEDDDVIGEEIEEDLDFDGDDFDGDDFDDDDFDSDRDQSIAGGNDSDLDWDDDLSPEKEAASKPAASKIPKITVTPTASKTDVASPPAERVADAPPKSAPVPHPQAKPTPAATHEETDSHTAKLRRTSKSKGDHVKPAAALTKDPVPINTPHPSPYSSSSSKSSSSKTAPQGPTPSSTNPSKRPAQQTSAKVKPGDATSAHQPPGPKASALSAALSGFQLTSAEDVMKQLGSKKFAVKSARQSTATAKQTKQTSQLDRTARSGSRPTRAPPVGSLTSARELSKRRRQQQQQQQQHGKPSSVKGNAATSRPKDPRRSLRNPDFQQRTAAHGTTTLGGPSAGRVSRKSAGSALDRTDIMRPRASQDNNTSMLRRGKKTGPLTSPHKWLRKTTLLDEYLVSTGELDPSGAGTNILERTTVLGPAARSNITETRPGDTQSNVTQFEEEGHQQPDGSFHATAALAHEPTERFCAFLWGVMNTDKLRIMDVFNRLDVYQVGSVSRDALFQGLANLGAHFTPEDVHLVMNSLPRDSNGTNHLDFPTLAQLLRGYGRRHELQLSRHSGLGSGRGRANQDASANLTSMSNILGNNTTLGFGANNATVWENGEVGVDDSSYGYQRDHDLSHLDDYDAIARDEGGRQGLPPHDSTHIHRPSDDSVVKQLLRDLGDGEGEGDASDKGDTDIEGAGRSRGKVSNDGELATDSMRGQHHVHVSASQSLLGSRGTTGVQAVASHESAATEGSSSLILGEQQQQEVLQHLTQQPTGQYESRALNASRADWDELSYTQMRTRMAQADHDALRIRTQAEEERTRILSSAKREAENLVAGAKAKADAERLHRTEMLLEDAEARRAVVDTELRRLRAQAEGDVIRMKGDARAEAQDLLADARTQAQRILAENDAMAKEAREKSRAMEVKAEKEGQAHLAKARDEAEVVITKARTEASAIKAKAREQGEAEASRLREEGRAVVARAREDADSERHRAAQESKQALATAAAEAATIREKAVEEGAREARSTRDRLLTEIEALQQQKAALESEIARLREILADLKRQQEEELAIARQRLADTLDAQQRGADERLQERRAAMQAEEDAHATRMQKLQDETDRAIDERRKQAAEDEKARRSTLQHVLRDQEAETQQRLAEEERQHKERLAAAQRKHDEETEEQRSALAKELAAAKQEGIAHANAEYEERKRALEADLEQHRRKVEADIAELELGAKQAVAKSEAGRIAVSVHEETKHLRREKDAANHARMAAEARLEDMKEAHEHLNSESARMQAEIDRLRAEAHEHEGKDEAASLEISTLRATCEQLRASLAEAELASDEIEQQRRIDAARLKQAEDEVAHLEEELARQRKAAQRGDSAAEDLAGQLSEVRDEADVATRQRAVLEAEVVSMREALAAKDSAVQAAIAETADANRRVASLENRVSELDEELARAGAERSDREADVQRLEEKMSGLVDEVASAKQAVSKAEAMIQVKDEASQRAVQRAELLQLDLAQAEQLQEETAKKNRELTRRATDLQLHLEETKRSLARALKGKKVHKGIGDPANEAVSGDDDESEDSSTALDDDVEDQLTSTRLQVRALEAQLLNASLSAEDAALEAQHAQQTVAAQEQDRDRNRAEIRALKVEAVEWKERAQALQRDVDRLTLRLERSGQQATTMELGDALLHGAELKAGPTTATSPREAGEDVGDDEDVVQLQREVTNLRQQEDQLREELRVSRASEAELRITVKSLEDATFKAEQASLDHRRKLIAATGQVASLKKEVERLKRRLQQHESDLDALQEENDGQRQKLLAAQRRGVAGAEAKQEEMGAVLEEIRQHEAHLAQTRARLSETLLDLEEYQSEQREASETTGGHLQRVVDKTAINASALGDDGGESGESGELRLIGGIGKDDAELLAQLDAVNGTEEGLTGTESGLDLDEIRRRLAELIEIKSELARKFEGTRESYDRVKESNEEYKRMVEALKQQLKDSAEAAEAERRRGNQLAKLWDASSKATTTTKTTVQTKAASPAMASSVKANKDAPLSNSAASEQMRRDLEQAKVENVKLQAELRMMQEDSQYEQQQSQKEKAALQSRMQAEKGLRAASERMNDGLSYGLRGAAQSLASTEQQRVRGATESLVEQAAVLANHRHDGDIDTGDDDNDDDDDDESDFDFEDVAYQQPSSRLGLSDLQS